MDERLRLHRYMRNQEYSDPPAYQPLVPVVHWSLHEDIQMRDGYHTEGGTCVMFGEPSVLEVRYGAPRNCHALSCVIVLP